MTGISQGCVMDPPELLEDHWCSIEIVLSGPADPACTRESHRHCYDSRGGSSTGMPETEDPVREPAEDPLPGSGGTALLHDLSRWREQLARSIARNNPGMRSGAIASAVNRILFSLLLLRFGEDRGLIATGTIRSLHEGYNSCTLPALLWYTRGLYAGDSPAGPEAGDSEGLVVEDRVLCTIFSALASPERRYDLSVMPAENLAEVLLRYLARTVRRSASNQAGIVDTHDTAISGGQTMPPLPLREYLVQSSLSAARAARSHRDPLPLRVLDPACGAGGILLSVYQDLLDTCCQRETRPGGTPGDPDGVRVRPRPQPACGFRNTAAPLFPAFGTPRTRQGTRLSFLC